MNLFSQREVNRIARVHNDYGMWGVNGEIAYMKKVYELTGDDTRYLRKLVKMKVIEDGYKIVNNQKD